MKMRDLITLVEEADTDDFSDHMIDSCSNAGVGFHFEEGGCWGMALALQDHFTARRQRSDLIVVAGDRHAMVLCDGVRYDHQGTVSGSNWSNWSKVTRQGLYGAARRAGVPRDEVESDRSVAAEIIANAVEMVGTGSDLVEAIEDYGVYLNTIGTRKSVEVYRGPKAWCDRYMRTMKHPEGTCPVVRSIATTRRIEQTLGIAENAVRESYLNQWPDPDRWRPILDRIEARVRPLGVEMQLYPMETRKPREIMSGNMGWALAWIERKDGAKGAGAEAMKILNAEADAWGQKVWLQADSKDDLFGYYEALGYKRHSRNEDGVKMVRAPDKAKKVHKDTKQRPGQAPGLQEAVQIGDLFDLTPGGGSRTVTLNGATLIYGVSKDSAEAISLRVSKVAKGTGAARAILAAFCDAADRTGLTLTLGASPLTKATSLGRLVRFYQSLGFELTGRRINPAGDPAMVRHPKTQIVEAVEADTPAERFEDAFDALFDVSPLVGKVRTIFHYHGKAAVEITHIGTQPADRGQGLAGRAMAMITQAADACGVTLYASPASDADAETGMGPDELRDWYERCGFQGEAGLDRMRRRPQAATAVQEAATGAQGPSSPFTATLFHGSDNPDGFVVDTRQGSLFTTFDEASRQGRYVFACRVALSHPLRARSEDELATMIATLLHGGPGDGCVFEDRGVRKVLVRDQGLVEVLECHDARCDLDEVDGATDHPLLEFVPDPGARIVLVTGQLASAGVSRVMDALGDLDFTFEVRPLDVAVAAWLTTERISEEIGDLDGVAAIVIPGKTTGDDAVIERRHGVKVLRGPACYSQLPLFFEYQGIEISADGVVRPKLVMLGRDETSARMLADTYEVPLLSVRGIIAELGPDDPLSRAAQAAIARGEPIPHNVKAEIVRGRILLPDMAKGFVLCGYPETARDAVWFDEFGIEPDAIVAFDDADPAVVDHYQGNPAFLTIGGDDRAAALYRNVEGRLQRCVMRG